MVMDLRLGRIVKYGEEASEVTGDVGLESGEWEEDVMRTGDGVEGLLAEDGIGVARCSGVPDDEKREAVENMVGVGFNCGRLQWS